MMKLLRWAAVSAAAATVALALLAAQPASASLGPSVFASCATNDGNACAGEVATGPAFRYVTASAFTRNPDQYAAITNGLGWQIGLKSTGGSPTIDAIIGISDVPNSGAGYSPQSLVYENGSLSDPGVIAPNALWCAAGSPCAPASEGGAFPVGVNVTLSVYYNKAEGTVNFDASDQAGDFYKAFYRVGHAVTFDQARVEAGYGSFTAPSASTRLVSEFGIGFTDTAGNHLNLRSATVTRAREFGTSDGTSAGTIQAGPGTVNKAGNAVPVSFLP